MLVIRHATFTFRRKARTHGKPQEEGEETQVSHYSTHQTTVRRFAKPTHVYVSSVGSKDDMHNKNKNKCHHAKKCVIQ